MKILTWRENSGNGAFQKPSEIPNTVFSDLLTIKPLFTFVYTTIDYIEQNGIYLVDGVPMSLEQQREVETIIDSIIIPMTWYKRNIKQMLEHEYKRTVEVITNVDSVEMSSWSKQEAEARAYMTDNTVNTPILTTLIVSRGLDETVEELAIKIISKVDIFDVEYSKILGAYQNKLKQVDLATSVTELLLIK